MPKEFGTLLHRPGPKEVVLPPGLYRTAGGGAEESKGQPRCRPRQSGHQGPVPGQLQGDHRQGNDARVLWRPRARDHWPRL